MCRATSCLWGKGLKCVFPEDKFNGTSISLFLCSVSQISQFRQYSYMETDSFKIKATKNTFNSYI